MSTAVMPHPALQRIAQIAVVVRDLDRAVHFYQDVLGLPLLFRADPGMAFLDCGGTRLMLAPAEWEEQARMSSILYYLVQDIAATHALLRDRGVRFEREPHLVARLPDHELWLAFLRDSEDNLLALMSEVR